MKTISVSNADFSKIFKIQTGLLNQETKYNCFFVRHGYSLHNDKKYRGDNYDYNTDLTNKHYMITGSQKGGKIPDEGVNTDINISVVEDKLEVIKDDKFARKEFFLKKYEKRVKEIPIRLGEINARLEEIQILQNKLNQSKNKENIEENEKLEKEKTNLEKEKINLEKEQKSLNNKNIDITFLQANKSGEQQAETAGIFFSNFMKKHEIKMIDAVAVSDLIRTQQTASFFLFQLGEKKINTKMIFVIPCLHELIENVRDGQSSLTGLFSRTSIGYNENKTNCRIQNIKKNEKDCSTIALPSLVNPSVKLNWDYYKQFYGNGFRDEKKSRRQSCHNTHFLNEFFKAYYAELFKVSSDDPKSRIHERQQPSQASDKPRSFLGMFSKKGGTRKIIKTIKSRKTKKLNKKIKTNKIIKTCKTRKTRKSRKNNIKIIKKN